MGGKTFGYVLAGVQIAVGAILTAFGAGAIGVPLMISGATTLAGTALSPSPPRTKSLRDSPTYGLDRFNPRGSDASIGVLFGEHRVQPAVVQESVASVAETNAPGVDATRRQSFRWLGAVCEGVLDEASPIRGIKVNDRDLLSEEHTEVLGKGNGTKRVFAFPHRNVWLGTDEVPAVAIRVDGVLKSFSRKSATADFAIGSGTASTLDLARSDKGDRILEDSVRLYIFGPGHPIAEQPRRAGVYRWSLSKLRPFKIRIRFATRPATGLTVRVAYDYLGANGVVLQRDAKGRTDAVFGAAAVPAAGHVVEAVYRTTVLPGLRLGIRRGTLDQSPLPGFGNLETPGIVSSPHLQQNAAVKYDTSGRPVDDLRLLVIAPGGFIQYKEDGGTQGVQARVRVEYRKPGGSWVVLRHAGGTEFKLSHEKPSTVRWSISIRDEWQRLAEAGDADAAALLDAFDRSPYEVQVTRLDKEQTGNPLIQDRLEFTTAIEVLHEGFVWPGTALLGIEALPNDIVTGGIRVSCIARRGRLWDPRTLDHHGRRDLGSSENAALALADLITSARGAAKERYGGGFFYSEADLFLGADGFTGDPPNEIPAAEKGGLIAFADWCDEWVHGPDSNPDQPPYTGAFSEAGRRVNGERRCRLNLVLDTPQSLAESVNDIAALSFCFAVAQGTLWRFPLDQDGVAVLDFVDDVDPPRQNAGNVHLTMDRWEKTPSHLVGQFWSRDRDWERDELPYPIDGLPEGRPLNPLPVNLAGCDRVSEAARMLRHLAEQATAAPYEVTWDAHPGVRFVEAGDVVALKTRVPYSTGSSALELKVRVLRVTTGVADEGGLFARYGGRVMAAKVYALQPATVPVGKAPAPRPGSFGAPPRKVKALRARVVPA